MLKKSCSISLLLLSQLLTSCATTPPNVPVCVELNPFRGGCVKVITGEKFLIDDEHLFTMKIDGKDQKLGWWDVRPYMVQLPPDSYSQFKAFVKKICKKTGECDKEVSSWENSFDNIDDQLKSKGATNP